MSSNEYENCMTILLHIVYFSIIQILAQLKFLTVPSGFICFSTTALGRFGPKTGTFNNGQGKIVYKSYFPL